ncbi:MAG: Ig-like domain-containing protein, partial [Gammaproteobacteria bacterium]|nr:Ig-like domain-containing protein [Gammaproteobacteria bacterium]
MRSMCCLLVAGIISGCGAGNGEGLDANGRPGNSSTGPLAATFTSIQDNVLTPFCTSCHAGSAAPLGLRLESGSSFALLVNIPSVQESGVLRVAPGDPDNSYLIQKLEGTAGTGSRMPLGTPPLPQSTIDVIRAWIAAGALPDEGQQQGPPTVVSLTPEAGSVSTALPAAIQIIFSAPMDGTLFGAETVSLVRAGGDGSFTDGNEVGLALADITVSSTNAALVTISLDGLTSVDDDYRLTLTATGATAIAGSDGQILDGDGDGTAGGDYVATFAVSSVLPTLESIQDNVFTPTCATTQCHTGPAGPGLPAGLDLSGAAASFANVVDVASIEVPSLLRVAPGDADDSYLIQKLKGMAAVGAQMPLGGDPLPWPTIDVIRDWINNGANFDGAADTTPPVVSLVDPGSPLSGIATLNAIAVDDIAVVSVEFLVDSVAIGSDDTAPYTISWDTTAVAD